MNNEKILEDIKEYFENANGFIKYNHMHIEELKDNYAKISVKIKEESLNPSGFAHGGLLFGLADTAMGAAARTNGRNIVTINSSIDYLKPGTGTIITAETEKIKVGKTTAVYRCNIYDDQNRLITVATGTYFFLD